MKYYDGEFRKALMELLTNFRKFLEQASIGSTDQNYTILVNNTIKKIDEYIKIIKPSMFDFLSVGKIEKLQEDEFLKHKAEELEQSFEERVKAETEKAIAKVKKSIREAIESEYDARLESEKALISEQLSTSISAKTEKALAKTYADRTSALEEEYADKTVALEQEFSKKTAQLEKDYAKKLKAEIDRITAELRIQLTDEITETITDALRQKLREEVKAELKQEREEKKKRKKAKKEAEAIEAVSDEQAKTVSQTETVDIQSEESPILKKPPDKKTPQVHSPIPISSEEKKYDEMDEDQNIDTVE